MKKKKAYKYIFFKNTSSIRQLFTTSHLKWASHAKGHMSTFQWQSFLHDTAYIPPSSSEYRRHMHSPPPSSKSQMTLQYKSLPLICILSQNMSMISPYTIPKSTPWKWSSIQFYTKVQEHLDNYNITEDVERNIWNLKHSLIKLQQCRNSWNGTVSGSIIFSQNVLEKNIYRYIVSSDPEGR